MNFGYLTFLDVLTPYQSTSCMLGAQRITSHGQCNLRSFLRYHQSTPYKATAGNTDQQSPLKTNCFNESSTQSQRQHAQKYLIDSAFTVRHSNLDPLEHKTTIESRFIIQLNINSVMQFCVSEWSEPYMATRKCLLCGLIFASSKEKNVRSHCTRVHQRNFAPIPNQLPKERNHKARKRGRRSSFYELDQRHDPVQPTEGKLSVLNMPPRRLHPLHPGVFRAR